MGLDLKTEEAEVEGEPMASMVASTLEVNKGKNLRQRESSPFVLEISADCICSRFVSTAEDAFIRKGGRIGIVLGEKNGLSKCGIKGRREFVVVTET